MGIIKPVIAAGLALGLLGGCAGVTEAQRASDCQAKDWAALGLADGEVGLPEAHRRGLIADCAALGAPGDLTAYRAGHEAGLARYCTEANGYKVGRSGAPYFQTCPAESAGPFLAGLKAGRTALAEEGPPPRAYAYHPGWGAYPAYGVWAGPVIYGIPRAVYRYGGYYGGHRYYRGKRYHHGYKRHHPYKGGHMGGSHGTTGGHKRAAGTPRPAQDLVPRQFGRSDENGMRRAVRIR